MFWILQGRLEPPDLVFRQDLRKGLFLLGSRNSRNGGRSSQHGPVQEANRAEGLIGVAVGPPRPHKVKKPPAHLVAIYHKVCLITGCRPVSLLVEASDVGQVHATGISGEPSKDHLLLHALEQISEGEWEAGEGLLVHTPSFLQEGGQSDGCTRPYPWQPNLPNPTANRDSQ